jgi:hypothetical protein
VQTNSSFEIAIMQSRSKKRNSSDLENELNFIPREFQPKCYDIKYILFQFHHGNWILSPEYQRNANIWPRSRQARLIHTIFDNLPINQLYLLERELEGHPQVSLFDGLQRLSALINFQENKLTVTRTSIPESMINKETASKAVSNLTFGHLNALGQRHFESYQIPIVVVRGLRDKTAYFSRLNYTLLPTHGEKLRMNSGIRTAEIMQLVTDVKEKLIVHKKSETRSQLFYRFCVLMYVLSENVNTLKMRNVQRLMNIKTTFSAELILRVKNVIDSCWFLFLQSV